MGRTLDGLCAPPFYLCLARSYSSFKVWLTKAPAFFCFCGLALFFLPSTIILFFCSTFTFRFLPTAATIFRAAAPASFYRLSCLGFFSGVIAVKGLFLY